MCNIIDKYKPTTLNDFISDDKTKELLNIFINIDSLNLLINGDTGTGKTTLINILIKDYYGNLYNKDNIIYINLLKEQGIHHFRQNIKSFCQTTNNSKKKKIVVIDNIDQINEQSQQIIRNNIDKYSHKVNFLLSCSNIQKVLDNLQSRVNIIKLNFVNRDRLYEYAKHICIEEELKIDDECIEYIVNISNDSIRLMLSYINKLKLLNEDIDMDKIHLICTHINYHFFDEYTKLWFTERDLKNASEKILYLTELGYSVMDVLESYFMYIKNISWLDTEYKFKMFPIICKYINIFHSVHEDSFELLIMTYELINICN